MFVLRIMIGRMLLYFAGVDYRNGEINEDVYRWAMLGNKIQSFVDEESALRALDVIKQRPRHHVRWDDSEYFLSGEDYPGTVIKEAKLTVVVLDLTDMVIARQLTIDLAE